MKPPRKPTITSQCAPADGADLFIVYVRLLDEHLLQAGEEGRQRLVRLAYHDGADDIPHTADETTPT